MDLIVLSDSLKAFMETDKGTKLLEGFSKLDFNPGVQSYIRQYFASCCKNTDVVGASPEILYTFDRMNNNPVHDILAEIADLGLKGRDAVKNVIFADFSRKSEEGYPAIRQSFTVIGTDRRPESGFLDYSGKMIAAGEPVKGRLALSDDLKSGEFIPERGGILCD